MIQSKRLYVAIIATLMLFVLTGCTTPGTEIDRERDFSDIFTFTTAKGSAFKLRIGPAQAGIVYPPQAYESGLRGGELYKPYKWDFDEYLIFHGNDRFCGTNLTKERGKSFEAKSMGCFSIPTPWKPKLYDDKSHSMVQTKYPWTYYTQTEIVIGIFTRWRVGINWGEMADFCLGWLNLDIYGDDLKIKEMMDTVRKAHEVKKEKPIIIDLSKPIRKDPQIDINPIESQFEPKMDNSVCELKPELQMGVNNVQEINTEPKMDVKVQELNTEPKMEVKVQELNTEPKMDVKVQELNTEPKMDVKVQELNTEPKMDVKVHELKSEPKSDISVKKSNSQS